MKIMRFVVSSAVAAVAAVPALGVGGALVWVCDKGLQRVAAPMPVRVAAAVGIGASSLASAARSSLASGREAAEGVDNLQRRLEEKRLRAEAEAKK